MAHCVVSAARMGVARAAAMVWVSVYVQSRWQLQEELQTSLEAGLLALEVPDSELSAHALSCASSAASCLAPRRLSSPRAPRAASLVVHREVHLAPPHACLFCATIAEALVRRLFCAVDLACLPCC